MESGKVSFNGWNKSSKELMYVFADALSARKAQKVRVLVDRLDKNSPQRVLSYDGTAKSIISVSSKPYMKNVFENVENGKILPALQRTEEFLKVENAEDAYVAANNTPLKERLGFLFDRKEEGVGIRGFDAVISVQHLLKTNAGKLKKMSLDKIEEMLRRIDEKAKSQGIKISVNGYGCGMKVYRNSDLIYRTPFYVPNGIEAYQNLEKTLDKYIKKQRPQPKGFWGWVKSKFQ